MHRVLTLVLVSTLLLPACGPKQVGGVPVPTINRVAGAARSFSTVMEEVQDIEIILYDKKQISAATHIEFQELYLELAPAGLALNESIRVAADGPEALEALRRALGISRQLLATTRRIRDEDARAKLVAIVVGAQAFLIVIESVIGGENDSTNPVTRRIPASVFYQPLPLAA